MVYPRLIIDIENEQAKIQAWPHAKMDDRWCWCVEITRPGEFRPPNLAGSNRPGWPEFRGPDCAWDAAEIVLERAIEYGLVDQLPVSAELRLLHLLAEYMEERE